MDGLETQKRGQRTSPRPATTPLPAIHVDLDAVGNHAPLGLGAQRQKALREYADALRAAGFWVRLGTYDVRASLGRGVGSSIDLVIDGRVILEESSGARSTGRLVAHGWRPSTKDAVDAAQRWLQHQLEPVDWIAAGAGNRAPWGWEAAGARMG